MDVKLFTVSKLCCNIIYTTTIKIDQIDHPTMDHILNKIHEKYPTLYETDYTLYWCYSRDEFFKIRDFLSYFTALTLMADCTIYLILNDCDDCLEFNEAFLRKLDRIDEKAEAERKRNKYDVKIVRPGEKCESDDEEDDADVVDEEDFRTEPLKEDEMLRFARRKVECAYYYTADLRQKFQMIEDAKRGLPVSRNILMPLPEEKIERAKSKDERGSKKGKKDNKDSAGSKGRKK